MKARCKRYAAAAEGVAVVFLLVGCETVGLPPPGPTDCQIRIGAAITEGTASFASIGGVAANVQGGAYTVIGDCEVGKDFVFAADEGAVACHGTETWCTQSLERQPVTGSPSALRQMILGEEEASP